jgi:hypothetical protein
MDGPADRCLSVGLCGLSGVVILTGMLGSRLASAGQDGRGWRRPLTTKAVSRVAEDPPAGAGRGG